MTEASQFKVDQTLAQAEGIIDRAGAELELVNDLLIQRLPDGTEIMQVKRQVRLQKDPH